MEVTREVGTWRVGAGVGDGYYREFEPAADKPRDKRAKYTYENK